MSSALEDQSNPDFEIDHPEQYAPYFLKNPTEISFYLDLLAKRGCLLAAHIDEGAKFFLTTIITVDNEKRLIFLDPAHMEEINAAARAARQVTLVANLDRIKIQLRIPVLQEQEVAGQKFLAAAIPDSILRLQRREFFRLEPPSVNPILCRIAVGNPDAPSLKTFELKAADISGGGISLIAPTELLDDCQRNALFKDSRLGIPDEGVLLVNLRVRKTVEFSAENGLHHLRVGCEYIGLPGSRLATIERYITRIERERKARDSGLAG